VAHVRFKSPSLRLPVINWTRDVFAMDGLRG